jgi:hypothetical protein
LLEEAVVAKKLVEVAEVVVALIPVKFCKVVEAVVCKAPVESTRSNSVPFPLLKRRKLPAKERVLEALIKLPVVVVANKPRRALAESILEPPRTRLVPIAFG